MNLEKLERMIGRDIKQATRHAERLDEEAKELRAKILALEAEKLKIAEVLAETTAASAEAWEWVNHLKEKA